MNAIVTLPTAAELGLRDKFRSLRAEASHDPLGAARDGAFAQFAAAGLPHRRIEAWHYTDLRGLLREALPPAPPPDGDAIAAAGAYLEAHGGSATRIVLVDGRLVNALSVLPAPAVGFSVVSVLDILAGPGIAGVLAAAEALGRSESLAALNLAFVQGGVVIDVAAGATLEQPIELISIASGSTPGALTARSYVRLGSGASATLIERHVALAGTRTQTNSLMVVAVEDGATLDHVARVDENAGDSLHLGLMLARLGANARLASLSLIASKDMTRRQTYLEFSGPGAKADLKGVALLDGRSHADTTLIVTHQAPHCESRELYKHILDGEATGVYQGKVIVARGAQKTDGKMLSKAVFLSEGAAMYNKPELEIFADDVVCGHGATAGSLDEDQLFYLRARGIPLAEAQALLLEAFAAEPIEDGILPEIRDVLLGRLASWLRQRGK